MADNPHPSHAAHLRGAARLATDATAGLTDLVEAMHARIGRLPGVAAPAGVPAGRTQGITGLVYRTVRGVTRLVGGSVDGLLGLLAPALGASAPGAERDALVAALNGVLGDYLATTGNPLATPLQLTMQGPATGRVVVLAHGLCMNDLPVAAQRPRPRQPRCTATWATRRCTCATTAASIFRSMAAPWPRHCRATAGHLAGACDPAGAAGPQHGRTGGAQRRAPCRSKPA
jgi:hypothetical protein